MEDIKKGKLSGIGIGPGDPELITLKAVKAIQNADVIYVPKSPEQSSTALAIVKSYIPENAVIEHLEFSMAKDINTRITSRKNNSEYIAQKLDAGKNSVFLTLGDPMLYSTYSYVLEYLDKSYTTETIPGIYSFAAISSILSEPLCKGSENLVVLSSFTNTDIQLINSMNTVVLMKVSSFSNELYNFLSESGEFSFTMISNAGKENQTIHNHIDILKSPIPYFSTAILKKL